MSKVHKSQKFVLETTVNGHKFTKLWDSTKPINIGHPRIWTLKQVDGGVEITKFAEVPGRTVLDPEISEQVAVAPDTLIAQGCRVKVRGKFRPVPDHLSSPSISDDEPTQEIELPVSVLSIQPARTVTPIFLKRQLSEHTKFFDLQSAAASNEAELFVFTCAGSWVITTEPFNVNFLRPYYIGYLHGKAVFKLKRDRDKFTIKTTHSKIQLKLGDQHIELPPGSTEMHSIDLLPRTEIRVDPFTWKFSTVQPHELEKSEFETEDKDAEYFRTVRNSLAIAFLLLTVLIESMPRPKVKEVIPDQLTKLNFEKPKILLKMPPPTVAPLPTPKAEPLPTPPPVAKVKPKPEPPRREPPKPEVRPTLRPKPVEPPRQFQPTRPQPVAPKQRPVEPKPVVQAQPIPAPPKVEPPQPPPPPPPPPPKVDVSKALSFLGATKKIKVTEVNPNKYQAESPHFDLKSTTVSTNNQALSQVTRSNSAGAPIKTSGAISGKTSAFDKRDLAGSKSLNGVEAKVSLNQVFNNDGSGIAAGEGLNVTGGRLSPEEIQKVLSRSMSQLQYCYERALLSDPQLVGTVTLSWTVSASGAVTRTQVIKSQLNNARLHECLAATVKKLTFPPPKGGDAQVEFPFHFSATRF